MSDDSPKWDFEKPENWQEIIKDIKKSNPEALKKLGKIMNELAFSEIPNLNEKKKSTKYGDVYTRNIDNSIRLAYQLDFNQHIITIVRLGDHKEVYGKD